MRIGAIEVFLGPASVGAPDDLRQVVIGFIDGAKSRLRVAVQEIEDEPVAEALIRARQRGVIVQVVIEADYLGRGTDDEEPNVADPGDFFEDDERFVYDPNREVFQALLRAGVDVKLDLNPKIMHQKIAIRDGDAVLTGSTNWTPTGFDKNLNHVVVLHDQALVKTFRDEFTELWRGTFGASQLRRDPKPAERWTGSGDDPPVVPVKALFAPDHGPEMEVMKQMLKARRSIDFAIFTFSRSSGIDDTMRSVACGSGAVDAVPGSSVRIRGSFDARQSAQSWAASHGLIGHPSGNIELFRSTSGGGVGKLHHKIMVIDEQVVIAGSFNYTEPATTLNDENIVVIGNLETEQDMPNLRGRRDLIEPSIAAQRQIAAAVKTELERIITVHTVPMAVPAPT